MRATGKVASSGIANGVVQAADLLTSYKAKVGLLSPPPGITVVAIRYRLSITAGAAVTGQGLSVTWGFIVAPDTSDSDDINPAADPHLDWMEYGRIETALPAGQAFYPVGLGDDGFRTVRSMRKMDEPGSQLWSVVVASAAATTWGYHLTASTVFKLP